MPYPNAAIRSLSEEERTSRGHRELVGPDPFRRFAGASCRAAQSQSSRLPTQIDLIMASATFTLAVVFVERCAPGT
jgi:hypothetical protein